MKIAQIVPLLNTIPPQKYGGIERVVTELIKGLGRSGHHITLFAAQGSTLFDNHLTLKISSPKPLKPDTPENRHFEIEQFLEVIAHQASFDIVHFHYEPFTLESSIDSLHFNFLDYIKKPVIITFHNQTHLSDRIMFYHTHLLLWKHHFVFLSHRQREPLAFLPNYSIIPNGIPVETFEYQMECDNYLLFLGRITPAKGLEDAIQVAHVSNRKLLIAAKIEENELSYYQEKIKPLIDQKRIIYLGEVGFEEKNRLLKNAAALVFPTKWEEPFGLVLIEALACGTPVVAYNRGSVPDIIEDGKTGFIVNSLPEMIQAVSRINMINRSNCRKVAEEKIYHSDYG